MSGKATIKNEDPSKLFTLQEKLGEGSYGSVYKAIRKSDGLIVAIKQVPIDEDIEELRQEIEVMKECHSDFIISYEGTFFNGTKEIWIVMEFCAAGSVADIMCVLKRPLDEEQIAVVCKFTLKGLQYLHKIRKIHRDIKAGNILLNERGRAKLADFGVAGHLNDINAKRMTVIGTPFWMAPEVVQEVGYNCKADIWSLGITAIEMAEMNPPLSSMHPMRAIFLIPSRDPPTLSNPEEWSDEFNDFIACCLIKDPEERCTTDELLKHPFIRNARSPSFLQPLVDECLQVIQDAGGRENAMVYEDEVDTMPRKAGPNSYLSSGEEEEFSDEDYGTIRRKPSSHSEEEEEEEEDECSGTMVRRGPRKDGSTPAFMKHIQQNRANTPSDTELANLSVEELKKLKRHLISEKAQKIQEIKDRYNNIKLPVQ